MIAFALLLTALPTGPDPCVCVGCAGFAHRERPGVCASCKGMSTSIDDRLCRPCAAAKRACAHCGKAWRAPKTLVGEATLVDKQPRPDLTYYVLKGDDGSSQGLYFDPKRLDAIKGRVLILAAEDEKGALVVRESLPLEPKEKDREVKGESDGPVHWRVASLAGPSVPSKDGTFSLVLPALVGYVFEVVSGEKVLSRHRFENGAWKELK